MIKGGLKIVGCNIEGLLTFKFHMFKYNSNSYNMSSAENLW